LPNVKSAPFIKTVIANKALSWTPRVSPHLSELVPYPAGKPIEETERELGIQGVVKLASNENPLGPSPLAIEAAAKELKQAHRYPDAGHYALKHKLSQCLGVGFENICIGNGSNELIDLIIRSFVQPSENVVAYQAAFVAYKLCAQLQGCGFKEAAMTADLNVSVDALLEQVDSQTRVVFLANPNNPTGGFLPNHEVRRLAQELDQRKVLLVLDYAYWEYVTDPSLPDALEVWRDYGNVIVLKTFSKIYGLAALRVGYAVADQVVAHTLAKARQPFNLTSIGLRAAEAALDDQDHVARSLQMNAQGLVQLREGLQKFDVHIFPSQGNFLFIDVKKPSAPLYSEFLQKGVILRPVGNYGFKTHFRVTVGLPEENEKFLEAAKTLLNARRS